jgi:hypothetical protein
MRNWLEPMKKVARMLRNHEELLLNWFKAKGESCRGVIEHQFTYSPQSPLDSCVRRLF